MSAPNFHVQFNCSRRRVLIGSVATLLLAACASLPSQAPPKILFVCQFGTTKSAIARELFRRRARERSIAVTVISRGLTIEDHISATLRQRLAAEGIDPDADAPVVLQPQDWQDATLVVAFNPLPSAIPASKIRDWIDLPSLNESYAVARPLLDKRIEALLDEFV
jgi:Low molecular weight phosphotyrosine protein phosphatase